MMSKMIEITDAMKVRSVVNPGDKSRLYSVIKRAARGETITFSVIGGSITHGCHAETRRMSYAELVLGWWKDKFPWTVVNYINAGIGATDSYIGVHRVDRHLISHDPDIVIVEFSVNDSDPDVNADSYKSLLEKILSSESSPAVILLFTLQSNGTNMQKIHSDAGFEYDLPMISYADAVWPEITGGRLNWSDISPDDIHPSSEGHRIISELINTYMDAVFSEAFSSDLQLRQYRSDKLKYTNAVLLDNRDIIPVENSGFKKSSVSHQFPYSWSTFEKGRLVFSVNAENIGIMYYRTVQSESGIYDVFIDGVLQAELDGDFSGGWGDYTEYREVYTSDNYEEHTIEIRMSDKSQYSAFTLMGLCIS